MKTTTKIVSVTILIGLMALVTPVLNVSAPQPTGPPFLDGDRVDLLWMSMQNPPIIEEDVPVDQPFYIMHGIGICFKGLPVEDRRMFLDDSLTRFELSIDGVPQLVRKWLNLDASGGCKFLGKWFYMQFDPYEFDVGASLDFEGRWYSYDNPLPVWSHTVTINFIASS